MGPNNDSTSCVQCNSTSFNAYTEAGICIQCPEHTRPTLARDNCILYEGYDINGTLMFLDALEYVQPTDSNPDSNFIGPFKTKNNIFFISPITPRRLANRDFEYQEVSDDDKANVFMLERTVIVTKGVSEKHERVKRILGVGVSNMNITNFTNGMVTVKYDEGDLCANDTTMYYTTEVTYLCDSSQTAPKVSKVSSDESGCKYQIFVYTMQACHICTKSLIKDVRIGSCTADNDRLYEYEIKNDSNCVIYFPEFESEMEIYNGSNTTTSVFDDVYESYTNNYVFESSVYMYCREVEVGYLIYLAFLGFLFICVLSLFITLICARKYRLLLYSRIKNKEEKVLKAKMLGSQAPSAQNDQPQESHDSQSMPK